MERPVDDTEKVHWYFHGLGYDFSTFSKTQFSLYPLPSFPNLVSKAESFEIFLKSLEPSTGAVFAFTAHVVPSLSGRGRGRDGVSRG